MRQIEGYPLWVGTSRDARDIEGVLGAGIEAIVDLAMLCEPVAPPRELVYLRFPLVDGADNPPWQLTAAVQAVAGLVRLGAPTLVACDGGMSRSLVIASAAVWFQTPLKTSLDEVLARLAEAGPCDVQPRLWADVKRFVFVCGDACYRPRG
jgi:hypothetical protein